jgi:tetratricopeptide (TPR) repeat protein
MSYQTNLDTLFDSLKFTHNPQKIKQIEEEIWTIWMHHPLTHVNFLMEKGCEAISKEQFRDAIDIFTDIIEEAPFYAEGWNKRATSYYLRGSYKQAIEDIQQALKIENRHFGALSGLASIYLMIGNFKGALKVFEKLASIYPHREDFRKQIRTLQQYLTQNQN